MQCFQKELEIRVLVFVERKTKEPGEQTLGAKTRTLDKLNPHVAQSLGMKPELQQREQSTLSLQHHTHFLFLCQNCAKSYDSRIPLQMK